MSEQPSPETEPSQAYTIATEPTWKRPDGTLIETKKELLTELNALLARAEKAEAERDELKRKLSIKENERRELQSENGRMRVELKSYGATSVQPVDWERVRIDAAIAAMQGVLANHNHTAGPETMVYFADVLVAELQKKEVEK